MKLSLFAAAVIAGSSMTTAEAQLSTHQKQPTTKSPTTKHVKIAPPHQYGPGGMIASGASDDCSSPKSVSGVGTYSFDTTVASTGAEGQGNPNCLFFATTGIDNDVWFVWNAPFTGAVDVSLCAGASHDAKLAVYDGAGCPANNAITCDDDFCSFAGPSRVTFAVTAGNDYTIQIGSYPNAAPGSGTFSINQYFPPTNDDCTGPTAVVGSGPHNFDNTTATTGAQGQNNPNCLNFGTTGIANDVWFTWQATFTGSAQASMCLGASHDARLAVYNGAGCPANTALGCDDDFCSFAGPSRTTFSCVAGNTYTLQLGNYPGAQGGVGTFTIDQFFPPAGDECTNATAIVGAGPHFFDNSNATTSAQGQNNPNCLFFGTTGIGNDVWYTWTAGFTGNAQATLCAGASHDAKVAVYAGAGCPAGQALSCDDDFCSFAGPSRATFAVVAGNTYTIQIGNYPGAIGSPGTFTVDPYFPPAGDECSVAIPISGSGVHAFDTTGMTTSAQGQNNPNCQFAFGGLGIADDQWFAWLSDCTGEVTVSLCSGATHDSKIAAYDGGGCPSNFALDCDDDTCLFAGPSEITFNAVAGNTYLIQIGNYATGGGGAGLFDVTCGVAGAPGTPFCAGDGSLATSCPCGNFGAAGNGCENSAGTGGAKLDATGSTGPDAVVFTSTGELPTALTIFLQGTNALGNGVVFGDGVRCVGGSLKRLYVKAAVGGVATAPAPGDPSVTAQSAALGDPIAPGTTRCYQAYYRDPNLGFCASPPGNSWNVSSGYQITWP